jgi:hypothetical protein
VKALGLLLVLSACSFAQSIFPNREATDQDMGVVTDQGASNLTGPVTATALTIPVANGLLFKAFNIPVVEGEKVLVCSVTPTALTICPNGRGLDGTVAAPHASGKPIYNLVHQTYPNRSRLEIEALEHIWFNGGDATIVNGLIRLTRATPFYSGVFTSQTSVVIPAGVHQQGCAIIAAAYDSAGRAILAGIGVDSSCNVTFTFATAQSGSYVIIGGGGTGISTNATQIQGVNIVNTAPVTNQFLFYNGTSWAPQFIDSSVLADTADIMRTTASATTGAFTYDFSGAAHTLPAKKGLVSALPAQCTVGEEYFATDAAAGSNKYYCTTSNIWTQQTGGGGGGGVSAVSGTSPIASSGGSTPAISCPTCLVGLTGTSNQITSSGGTSPVLSLPNVLNIGIPAVLSQVSLFGNTSGTVTIQPQATAGTPTLTLPNTAGTFAVGASSPLALSATTGNLTCPTCNTSAAALTSGQLLIGGGLQAIQTGNLSGDVTTSGGTATTLATVNGGPGACGDATHVCAITTNGKGLVTAQSATTITPQHSIMFSVDGGGSAITTGDLNQFPTANYSCTINKAQISANQSGSITIDIWKANAAIPTSGNKISASAPVTLSSAQLNQASSLSGWTLSVSPNDVFGATIVSASTVQKVTVQLWCQ